MQNRSASTQRLTSMAMLAAVAYLMVVFIRIPVVQFLKYEPKDVAIIIGGFLFGPFPAFLMSVVVSLVEMVTISDTGLIGFVMNVLSTCSLACTAAFIYQKHRTFKGAVIGLVIGGVLMTIAMMLWNYLITPLYMGIPREAIVAMLPTAFLPFNLLKGFLNGTLTVLLYKPVVTALRRAHLVPETRGASFNADTPAAAFAAGSADKIKRYKDLLDSGAISQEEFEEKKKQALKS